MTEVGSSDNAARRVASDGRFMATWLICFLFTNKTRTDDSVRHLLVFLSAHMDISFMRRRLIPGTFF